jgi:hypothetical protein
MANIAILPRQPAIGSRRSPEAIDLAEPGSMRLYDSEKLQNAYRAYRDQGGEQAVLDFRDPAVVAQQIQK